MGFQCQRFLSQVDAMSDALNKLACGKYPHGNEFNPDCAKCIDAALDEIERLYAENSRLRRNLAGAYRDQGCADDEIAEYLDMDLYPDEAASTRQKPVDDMTPAEAMDELVKQSEEMGLYDAAEPRRQ